MSNTVLTTEFHRSNMAGKFIEDVTRNPYYVFMANHSDPEDSGTADPAENSVANSMNEVYRNMIAGKIIPSNSVSVVIRAIPYEANTVYTMYDDRTADLDQKDFYVVVDASSYKHVYKCLDNNLNAVSTVIPDFSDISGSNTHLYQTSDGYRWKYMYTYTSADALKFETSSYIPVTANNEVSANATIGSIDIIKIEEVGRKYNNYVTGTFRSQDVTVNGDDTLFAVSNASVQTVNGYYTGCMLYLSSGTGAGQYKEVTDFISNGNGNFLVVNSAFTITPTNGTEYEVYPKVKITGSGTETVTAEARALINSVASNSVYRVEMLDHGRNYVYATAEVQVNAVVGVTQFAEVRPILPPRGGHGFNPINELYAKKVVVTVSFANSESNTIPSTNFYRQVGIIRAPRFRDVTLDVANNLGTFLTGETIMNVIKRRLKNDVVTTSGNNVISSNTDDFTEYLVSGDELIIGNDSQTRFQYTSVNSVTNASHIVLNDNVNFTSTEGSIDLALIRGIASVGSVLTSNSILSTSIDPTFTIGNDIIGQSTGATATITAVRRSGVAKDYSTFVQMNKYVGSLTFGVFEQNESVSQGDSTADLHSYSLNSGVLTLYTSNQVGSFETSNTITGSISTAIMAVTAKYQPELIFASGTPIYIENLPNPIVREADQTETFKIVLNF